MTNDPIDSNQYAEMRRLRALAATVALQLLSVALKLLSSDGSTAKELERSQVSLDLIYLTLESMLRDSDTATSHIRPTAVVH